ncbi:hypothetical protein Tco_0965917 [Tanacetum coccineum]
MLPKFSQIVNRLYAFIYETNHSKSGLGLPSIVALVMVIDKSWTSLGKHEKAFYTGLKKFVDDCKPLVDSAGNIRCPCKSCRLVLWVSIKHLSDHISKYGFDPSYKTWIHHGEPDLPPPPPVIDNTRQPQMSDMTACLNDLSYIPLNNEQNEPTQGDIGETSNDPTQAKRNEFEELYASANEELYPGCDHNQFDLKPHMESERWTKIHTGIQQHLQKIYNGNKAALKDKHWVQNPETGTYDVESIRRGRPANIFTADWDAQIAFCNDPKNLARCAQNRKNQAKCMVVCRQGSRSLAAFRDQMSSATREYPSLIQTFFQTHTVGGVFLRDEDRALYDEMLRLHGLGSNTETGVPYTDDEIIAIVRKGKQRGHLPGVGRVLPGQGMDVLSPPSPRCTHLFDVEKLKKSNKRLTKQVSMIMKLFKSDDKMSQMLTQLESSPEFGSANGSGGCGDDEPDDDEDGGEDEEDADS